MTAVAHASPAGIRRLALVRTDPIASWAAARRPTTMYLRRRAVALVLLLAVSVGLVLAARGVLLSVEGSPRTAIQGPGAYVVQPGDTFWGIASRLHPGEDPRPLVARMVAAHGSPVLVVGERLRLPPAR